MGIPGLLALAVAWGPAFAADAVIPGDFDGDGVVSQADIDGFTTAMLDRSRFLEDHPEWSVGDVISLGDVNGDGKFNKKDVREFRKLLKASAIAEIEAVEDFNGDGVVDRKDRRAYKKAIREAKKLAGRELFEGLRDIRRERAGRRSAVSKLRRKLKKESTEISGGTVVGSGGASVTPSTPTPVAVPPPPGGSPPAPTITPIGTFGGIGSLGGGVIVTRDDTPPGGAESSGSHEGLSSPSPGGSASASVGEEGLAIRTALPGSGFSGPTPEPDVVRTDEEPNPVYKAMARWDVVPYQTFTGEFVVGVVAFHRYGIDRVLFSVNGGEWVTASSMIENPRTGVKEYCVKLDASQIPDGPVEVRAVAIPMRGRGRVLEPLHLFAGSGGSLPPQIIELDAGTYPYPDAATIAEGLGVPPDKSRWVVLRPKPGVSRDQVIITFGASIIDHRLLWQNVTFRVDPVTPDPIIRHSGITTSAVWVDQCVIEGAGFEVAHWYAKFGIEQYYTRSSSVDVQNGFLGARIARDCEVVFAGEDGFKSIDLLVNCEVKKLTKGNFDYHADAYQTAPGAENVIVYGLITRDQNIHMANQTNCAYVDIHAYKPEGQSNTMAIRDPNQHVLFKSCTFEGEVWLRTSLGFTADDVVFDNCSFRDPDVWSLGEHEGVTYIPDPPTFD